MEGNCRVINSNESDKEFGMNYIEKLLRLEGKDIRTIIWLKEDEKGHHWFEVSWSEIKRAN